MGRKTLPEDLIAEIVSALDKPDNGILIVELKNIEAKQLYDYIKRLTFGDLAAEGDYVPAALHKILQSLLTEHQVVEID
ncbi:MAG: hypothetical protein KAJ19_25525 [Gammaproteobacteria bacterium]|nr:hypothetical protein [Gammaproteobacteria bacterium]